MEVHKEVLQGGKQDRNECGKVNRLQILQGFPCLAVYFIFRAVGSH
jgi:hypothetical protein